MIVTTAYEPSQRTMAHARDLADKLHLHLVPRKDESLHELRRKHQTDHILVVSAKGARLEMSESKPFFFHPNTAAFRIKRLDRGDNDAMLSACQIQPDDTVLDATLGLGADAIVFAHAVGTSGRVVGIESQAIIAILVEDGLLRYQTPDPHLQEAMSRVEVMAGHHLDVLCRLPGRSFDVVYFDPMFTQAVEESSGIASLRFLANETSLSLDAVEEALRVARRRVVLKEDKMGTLHERFGFTPFRKRAHHVVYSYREVGGGE